MFPFHGFFSYTFHIVTLRVYNVLFPFDPQWGGEFPDQKCSGVLLLNLDLMPDFIRLSDGWNRMRDFQKVGLQSLNLFLA